MFVEPAIVIVGQDSGLGESLRALGLRSVVVGALEEALPTVRDVAPPFVLLNLAGETVEPAILQQLLQETGSVLILADPGSPSAPPAINGKIEILPRPLETSMLQEAVRLALERYWGGTQRPSAQADLAPANLYRAEYVPLLLQSAKMRGIKDVIEQVANTNATVLLRGESGVGKDLVARAIHHASPRRDQPFVRINCAALPGDLLESELFGHEKGAFTGAHRKKLGRFEFAHKGTLFLDEIGELPLGLQAKLLHVLQDQEFSRVGGRETIQVDARIIASTNRDLESALGQGQFREDLYYRLNVVEIRVPPLRERKEEIPFLLSYYLEKFQKQYNRVVSLPAETVMLFTDYDWPGNIRELENVVRRLVVLGSVPEAQADILRPLRGIQANESEASDALETSEPKQGGEAFLGLREVARRAAREAERKALSEVLERVHWNRAEAARVLKVSYKTLLSKITECGLAPKPPHPRS
jgi:two-component system response regulator AtoC